MEGKKMKTKKLRKPEKTISPHPPVPNLPGLLHPGPGPGSPLRRTRMGR